MQKLDRTVRSWLKDGSITAKAAEKWLCLLGGTDHDRAEEVLRAYIRDNSVLHVTYQQYVVWASST